MSAARSPGPLYSRAPEEDENSLAVSSGTRPHGESSRTPPVRPVGSGAWRSTFSSLGDRNFLYLWLGMLAMMGGMQMQMLVRGYLVYDLTGSASLLGIVSASSSLPILALSLFGGAVADRVERKRVIQVGQAAAATLALLVGVAIATDRIGLAASDGSLCHTGSRLLLHHARAAGDNSSTGRAAQARQCDRSERRRHERHDPAAPAVAGGIYAWVGPDRAYFVISG